ncbi:MAG TPA: ATP-grasp domain-containing protein [Candidatus Fimimorpha faecalis]|uniref:ATP-grasp domain-containing protein n=1 Tax=Candidatus Fimimorpha faecalis TaxID=2840824 RepID=A0A9D1ECK1_9FIRM|nr:ATP-grasp domain-containing protein [Candidatus Fimimorpha faecalis]
MKRIFIGPKYETIKNSNFFDGSITLFGENRDSNISYAKEVVFEYWNPDNNPLEIEIYNKAIANITDEVEIMAHNPQIVSKCILPSNVHLICKNEEQLLRILDNKIETRNLMKSVVPMLKYDNIKGKDISYKKLSLLASEFVIQHPIGSGGSKTFLYNENTYEKIDLILEREDYYSISIYQRNNISYNIHCIIFSEKIEILAPSQQILEKTELIEYIGSEFEVEIPKEIKRKLEEYSLKLCKKIQKLGYRGVLGIDFIAVDNELYFIEINPRFQGSTAKVDSILKESNLPSIFEYNYCAFYNIKMPSTKNMKCSVVV